MLLPPLINGGSLGCFLGPRGRGCSGPEPLYSVVVCFSDFMIRDAKEGEVSNNVVDGHVVCHVRHGPLFKVYQCDDFQLCATDAVQTGNREHFDNPDMKSSLLSLGKPRGDLLTQEEESPEGEKRYPVSIEDQAWVGLPLV